MLVNNNILEIVVVKFPDQKQEIESLFVKCEEFRDICEDYVICLNSIKKIESADTRKDEYLNEFKSTLDELEEELLLHLKSLYPTHKKNNKPIS